MADACNVAFAPHCPLGPIVFASCLAVDFISPNAILQEQSLGIHYNEGLELTDYAVNKEDFASSGRVDRRFPTRSRSGNQQGLCDRAEQDPLTTGRTRSGDIWMVPLQIGKQCILQTAATT